MLVVEIDLRELNLWVLMRRVSASGALEDKAIAEAIWHRTGALTRGDTSRTTGSVWAVG